MCENMLLTQLEFTDSSVSKVKNPSSIVSGAAYLLFYRRRSSVPLGGPRFQQICDEFDRSADDSDGAGSGDDQEVGGSSLYGSSTAGKTGAGVTHLRGGSRGLDNSALGGSVQPSIEDEGIEMGESSNTTAATAYKTEWSFGDLDGREGGEGEDKGKMALVDYASDDAQRDSGSEGRASVMDADFPLPGGAGPYSDEAAGPTQITVTDDQGQDSDAVAEIRLEDESRE